MVVMRTGPADLWMVLLWTGEMWFRWGGKGRGGGGREGGGKETYTIINKVSETTKGKR